MGGRRIRLWTSRYQNRELAYRDDLVKVRTTLGRPRFALAYELEDCRALAPHGCFHLEGAAFERAYRARLRKIGVEEISARLREISARNGGRDLVLLCFEDVHELGDDACHRRSFARWWQEQKGETIHELPATASAPEQGRLPL